MVPTLLIDGEVLFSESNTKLDSCKQYIIEGIIFEKKMKIRVENCETKATVLDVLLNDL